MKIRGVILGFVLSCIAVAAFSASQTVITSFVAPLGITLGGTNATTPGGAITNLSPSSVQTSNYTIASTDCGSTVQAGSGSTGQFTLTLPNPGGFPANCQVTIKNGDSTRGKTLSGFPTDLYPMLWPNQVASVKILNGSWTTSANPGVYIAPGSLTLNVNHTSGSDASGNDCLGTGSGACQTVYHAYLLGQTLTKPGAGGTFTIQTDCNFTETPPAAFLGPTASGGAGGGVAFIVGNESSPSSCKWTSNGIRVDDGAVISLNGFETVNGTSGVGWLNIAKMGLAVFTNMTWGPAVGGAHITIAEGGAFVYDGGSYTVGDSSCAPNCFNYHILQSAGSLTLQNATISVPNALSFTAWYSISGSGSTGVVQSLSFTGPGAGSGSTGQPYSVGNNAYLQLNGTTFPGSGSPKVSNGGCTDTVCVPGSVSQFSQISTLCGNSTAGAYAFVGDSTTNTWGATITGGGGNSVLAFCNGANWTVAGK